MGRIAYVILTCEKYVHTRIPWQKQTTLKDVPSSDLFYLGHTMDPSRRLFSWGADDSYNGLPYKYTTFFQYCEGLLQDYDWIVLMDDDTYVYQARLRALLQTLNPQDPIAIGKNLYHIAHTQWGVYFSGGAGTVLSRTAFEILRGYVKETAPLSIGELVPHWCADISMGFWFRKHPQIFLLDHSQFHPEGMASAPQDKEVAITWHHLKTWEDYQEAFQWESN